MKHPSKYNRKKTLKCWNCHTTISVIDNELVEESKTQCPHCKVFYPEKPINEAKLSLLQEEYLATRDIKILNKMMLIMQDLIYNLICSRLKSSGKFLEEEVILDKVQWTLLKMTGYYMNKPYFKISSSFTEYLNQVILYPLYNYKNKNKDQNEISINTPIKNSNDGKEQTLLDKISNETILDGTFEVEDYFFKEEIKNNTISLVQDFIKSAVSIAEKKKGFSSSLKLMILFNHYLNNRQPKFFNNWWKLEGFELRDNFEKSLELLRRALYESAER